MNFFDPHCNHWLKDKFAYYKQLRQQKNLYFSEKYQMFVVTKYEDVLYALKNSSIFSSGKGNLIVEEPHRFGRTLGASDNPRHDVFKNIVLNAYSKSNVDRIASSYKNNLSEHLVSNSINLSDVIHRTSSYAVAEIINLPYEKEKIADLIYNIQTKSKKCLRDGTDTDNYDNFRDIVDYHIDNHVPSTGPGIYHEYLNNNAKNISVPSLFTGPTISGASSLSGAVQFLVFDLFREKKLNSILHDKNLIPSALNESLRFNASTGRFSRTVTQDIILSDTKLQLGDRVALCLDSANRDETKFIEPDLFDLNRDTSGHLGFGYGLHACIASVISKALMKVFLESILNKFGMYKITHTGTELSYLITSSGNNDFITNLILEKD